MVIRNKQLGVTAFTLALSLGLLPSGFFTPEKASAINNYVPQLNVYRQGNNAKIEIGIDMADADVVSRMSYETNETMPSLTYQPNDGHQSFSTDTAYSGSRSEKITDTISSHTGNHWDYPGTQADVSYTNYGQKYAPNNSWFSVSYKVKQIGGTHAVTNLFLDTGAISKGLPTTSWGYQELKFAQNVDFHTPPTRIKVYTDGGAITATNGAMLLLCLGKGTNYDYEIGWYKYDASTQELVRDDNSLSGAYSSSANRSIFYAGEDVLLYNEADLGLSNRNTTADGQWHTYSANGHLVNNLYDYNTRGFNPALSWGTDGTAYIDDVKFGYASKVNVYRDGIQIYSDFGSDITDTGVAIKPNAPTITSMSVGKGTAQVNFTDTNKTESHVYTANAISNATGDISATSTPVTLNMTSNIAGYSYVLDNSPSTVPSNTIMTTSTNLNIDSSSVDLTKPVYLHIKAIDTNGLVSDVTHYMYANSTAQTISTAETAIQGILPSLTATNSMTSGSLLSTLNSAVDTGYITLGISGFNLTPATETASGSVTCTVSITDKFGGTATVPVNLTITQLNQSLDTLVALYNSALPSLNVTNSTVEQDIVKCVNIPFQDVSASMTGFNLKPATETSNGSITGDIVLTRGTDTRTVPVNLAIKQLNQSLDTIVGLYTNALPSLGVSNATTANDIKNCVNIPYQDVSVAINNFNLTPATETATGSITGNIVITKGSDSRTVPFNLTVSQLNQSLDTIAKLYSDALPKYFATNGTTATDIKNLVNVPYLDVAVSINNFQVVPSTELTDGSITGEVLIQRGADYKSVPINLNIKHLPVGLANAVALVQGKVKSEVATNSSTYNDLLNDISTVITNPLIHVSWNADSQQSFTRKDATEQSTGFIKGVLNISDGSTTINLPVDFEIAKLPQTVKGTMPLLQAKIDAFTATNNTTDVDIIACIKSDSALTGSYTVEFGKSSDKAFTKNVATYNNAGSIVGSVFVSDGTNTEELHINLPIAQLHYVPTSTDTKSFMDKVIGGVKVTNSSTAQDILEAVKKQLPSYLDVGYTPSNGSQDITKVEATVLADGFISGVLHISDGTTSTDIPFNYKIDKLPATPAQVAKAIYTKTQVTFKPTNDTEEKDVLNYLKGVVPEGISVSFDSTKGFNKKYATYSEDGAITGTIIFKDSQGNTDSLDLNLVISKVIDGSSNSGSSSSHHSSGSGSTNGDSTNGNTNGSSSYTMINSSDISMRNGKDGTSYKLTPNADNANLSELARLYGDMSKYSVLTYSWEAYKNNILVNKGTLSVVQDATKCLGVYVDANSPLDQETSIDILVPKGVVNNLSNIYTFNPTIAKYVKSQSSLSETDDSLAFTGTNKKVYLITNEQLSSNLLAYQGWNSLQNNVDWAYLDGENCVTGWKADSLHWYYMGKDNVMQVGWLKDRGTWYHLNTISDGTKGAMQTGWINDGGTWYYLNSSGAMVTGWKLISGDWYYFDGSGKMLSNTQVEGYLLGSDGKMI